MKKYLIMSFIVLLLFDNTHPISNSRIDNEKLQEESLYELVDISVNVEQEFFPVIAKMLSEGYQHPSISGLVTWQIQNNHQDSIRLTISCEIPEWTTPVKTQLYLAPLEVKEIIQTPFGIKLLNNRSTIPAAILLNVKLNNEIIFEETQNIKIRAADDMIWSFYSPWDTRELIAAWITPKDVAVEEILTRAKEKLSNRTLAGYLGNNLLAELKAIFNAVRNSKISYVNSAMSFGKIGFTQRVRLPHESINQKSANCIDGSVLFASLFENLGLESLIVLLPGHAIVGVRDYPNSPNAFFIETTLVGRSVMESIMTFKSTFDAALEQGTKIYSETLSSNPDEVFIIDIKEVRKSGIYPMW